MTTAYFSKCRTAEECKRVYHELAKQFHPDGAQGSEHKMKELNRQYKIAWERLKDVHFSQSEGKTYTAERKTKETADEFIEIIETIARFDGIEIELCGTWLWLAGNTYQYKEELKAAGCRWSGSKKKWYWTKDEYIKTRHTLSESARRLKYGSEVIDTESYRKARIAAN